MNAVVTVRDRISNVVARYWLEENQYCGMSLPMIAERLHDVPAQELERATRDMEDEGELSSREFGEVRWVYPQEPLLRRFDDSDEAKVGRYTKRARLGGSQVKTLFFARTVLDRYRDDPRFRFDDDGVQGYVGIRDQFYLDEATPEHDKISLRLGTAYAPDGARVVTVILKDLDGLPLPHQQHWASYELEGSFSLDADFYAGAFEGQWTDRVSIFRALVQEMVELNTICKLTGDPPLFRNDYGGEPPRELGWLTKPTRNALHACVHTLDKLLSENLNKDFFRGKISLTEEHEIEPGKVRVVDRGTIALLEAYLKKMWRVQDASFIPSVIGPFRKIRKLRQEPAHQLGDDEYDPAVLAEQKALVDEAYVAVRGLRLLMANHPRAREYAPPDWLQEGRIG